MFNKILIHSSLITIIVIASCCSSKKTNESVITPKEDSMIAVNVGTVIPAGVPKCILELINTYRKEPKQNPPRKIVQYMYKGQKVFYITPPCCDFFSDLLDVKCRVIAHPDGGITGRGDGKAPDFDKVKKGEKIIWEDKRK